jgi:hypothetical protein
MRNSTEQFSLGVEVSSPSPLRRVRSTLAQSPNGWHRSNGTRASPPVRVGDQGLNQLFLQRLLALAQVAGDVVARPQRLLQIEQVILPPVAAQRSTARPPNGWTPHVDPGCARELLFFIAPHRHGLLLKIANEWLRHGGKRRGLFLTSRPRSARSAKQGQGSGSVGGTESWQLVPSCCEARIAPSPCAKLRRGRTEATIYDASWDESPIALPHHPCCARDDGPCIPFAPSREVGKSLHRAIRCSSLMRIKRWKK